MLKLNFFPLVTTGSVVTMKELTNIFYVAMNINAGQQKLGS